MRIISTKQAAICTTRNICKNTNIPGTHKILEDVRVTSDWKMSDTLSEGKINNIPEVLLTTRISQCDVSIRQRAALLVVSIDKNHEQTGNEYYYVK